MNRHREPIPKSRDSRRISHAAKSRKQETFQRTFWWSAEADRDRVRGSVQLQQAKADCLHHDSWVRIRLESLSLSSIWHAAAEDPTQEWRCLIGLQRANRSLEEALHRDSERRGARRGIQTMLWQTTDFYRRRVCSLNIYKCKGTTRAHSASTEIYSSQDK